MEKEITIKEFSKELIDRIEREQDIACCKTEIRRLAELAEKELGEKKILVTWKD